jgi:class 3 adenylate cyclase
LTGFGFTVEEMAAAERRGRLFGLAGDVLLQSGPQTFSLRTAATSIGVELRDVEYGWSMLGLTAADVDSPMLSQADVDALATWVALRARWVTTRPTASCGCSARPSPGWPRPPPR